MRRFITVFERWSGVHFLVCFCPKLFLLSWPYVVRSPIAVGLSCFLTLDYSLITHSFTLRIRAKRVNKSPEFRLFAYTLVSQAQRVGFSDANAISCVMFV